MTISRREAYRQQVIERRDAADREMWDCIYILQDMDDEDADTPEGRAEAERIEAKEAAEREQRHKQYEAEKTRRLIESVKRLGEPKIRLVHAHMIERAEACGGVFSDRQADVSLAIRIPAGEVSIAMRELFRRGAIEKVPPLPSSPKTRVHYNIVSNPAPVVVPFRARA